MAIEDIVILIPSHGLEDFPTELGEDEAAGLLNAFAIAWHPALIAAAGVLPTWRRADDHLEDGGQRVVIVPTCCRDLVPAGTLQRLRASGVVVVAGMTERNEMLAAVLAGLDVADLDPELVADCLALGTCYLQLELLTRQMHHFNSMDEVHLQREVVAASRAVLANDADAARSHLTACFDVLMESRELFYPVDCYLIDLCLLIPDISVSALSQAIEDPTPTSFLLSGEDLQQLVTAHPQLKDRLRTACERGTADVVGGEFHEGPVPMIPVDSWLWQFRKGHAVYREITGREPRTWGRRRFGLCVQTPQVLNRLGYRAALHVAFDDGIYPDAEQSKIRWEGCDGSVIDAMTRIPLAADSSASFLRFPQRLAESMEQDQVALVVLARWPEVQTPWLADIQRIHTYAPVLGKFVTLEGFFDQTETPGRLSSYKASEYLTPTFSQAVAKREADPAGRYQRQPVQRRRYNTARWYQVLAELLAGQSPSVETEQQTEAVLEQAHAEATEADWEAADQMLDVLEREAADAISQVLLDRQRTGDGVLVVNPLSFRRVAIIDWPEGLLPPARSKTVEGTQFDGLRRKVAVNLPGSGFVWIPAERGALEDAGDDVGDYPTLAEEAMLRNEFFEVHLNEETGGISQLKGFGRKPNRLSQQIAFRFPSERITRTNDIADERSYYSEMRIRNWEATSDGPLIGELECQGEIFDQTSDKVLATFTQRLRVNRFRPFVEVDLELEPVVLPDGNPWLNYFACRFAWNDAAASLTRSLLGSAHAVATERFESSEYLEIASDSERTTILHPHATFHRKTGMRMVDCILLAEGETRRKFRFAIGYDVDYPMQAAEELLTPPLVLPVSSEAVSGAPAGWFFHLDVRNVLISRLMPCPSPAVEVDHDDLAGNDLAGDEDSTHSRDVAAATSDLTASDVANSVGVDSGHAEDTLEATDQPSWEATGGLDSGDLPSSTDMPSRGNSRGPRVVVRLRETEGRRCTASLRCFRTPVSARQIDFRGKTIVELSIIDDVVRVEVTPHEIADIELQFAE